MYGRLLADRQLIWSIDNLAQNRAAGTGTVNVVGDAGGMIMNKTMLTVSKEINRNVDDRFNGLFVLFHY